VSERDERGPREAVRELRGERPEGRALGIDLVHEASIPVHDDASAIVDLVDDAPVSGAEPGVLAGVADELDPHPDRHSGSDAGGEKFGTLRVHGWHIGFEAWMLNPPSEGSHGRRAFEPGEDAVRRRIVPNSTAMDRSAGRELVSESPSASRRRQAGGRSVLSPRRKGDSGDERREKDQTDGLGALMRRILAHNPSPEERLEQLLAERRREFDERAAHFEETIVDLERREQLLRDSRASVERLLRLGTSDLDARELDLARLVRDLTEREARIREEESEAARRRSELGAVELKRATVERRERALEDREAVLATREAQLEEREAEAQLEADMSSEAAARVVLFVPGPAYRLVEIEHRPVVRGTAIRLDGDEYVVARTGPSPLPGDPRACVYLVRGAPGPSPSAGSS